MQTVYAYLNNAITSTAPATVSQNWRLQYAEMVTLYKNEDNTIEFMVVNAGQIAVDISSKNIEIQIVDRELKKHLITQLGTIVNPSKGQATVTISSDDVNSLDNRFYHIIARLVDPNDGSSVVSSEILYLDDNYGAFRPIIVEDERPL